MSIISMILVVIVAFLAGIEGVVDEFQFHQPLVACTLIGLVTGNLEAGIVLGGSLQMIALGWANIGAAVAPDAALASVASAIILVLGGQGVKGVSTAIAVAIPLAVAGLFLTMVVRTLSVACVHRMDAEAEKVNFRGVEMWHIIAICLQGLRIAIPAACLLAIPTETVQNFLQSMPAWLTDGMSIGGGMVVAVGYAMVINMIATKEVWPFFAIGFCLAAISDLTLIALGATGLANIPIKSLIAVLVPLLIGFIWGNLDKGFRDACKTAQPIVTFFMTISIGAKTDIKTILTAGASGIVLGLISAATAVIFFFVINLLLPKKERNAMGAAIGTTALNSAMTPAAVAEADPSMEGMVSMATAQCATASIITLFLCPFITAAFDKWMQKRQKGIYSPEGWAYDKVKAN